MKKSYFIFALFLALLLVLALSGCGLFSIPGARELPEETELDSVPNSSPTDSNKTVTLPSSTQILPPVLVTVPAGAIRADLTDSSGATNQERSLSTGTVDPDKVLGSEVDALLASLKRGEIFFSPSAGQSAGVKTAYTYRDLNGDNVKDLVVIIVANQGGVVSVSAGASEDGTAIQLAPQSSGKDSVQALSIELPGLAEVASLNEVEGKAAQAIVLKLEGNQLKLVTALD